MPIRADDHIRALLGEPARSGAQKNRGAQPPAPSNRATTVTLQLPLKVSGGVDLERFKEWPLTPFRAGPAISEEGGCFFFRAGQVVCRSLPSGQVVWSKPIGHGAASCGFHGNEVIVSGHTGVSCLRRGDGELLWQFHAPLGPPLPTSFPEPAFRTLDLTPDGRSFSHFCLAGTRLFFRCGRQRIIALDVTSGEVLWQRAAPGAPIRSADEGAGFREHYAAHTNHVLLQTTGGECLCLAADDGRIRFRRPAPAIWAGPPIVIDSNRAVIPAEGDRIRALDLSTGKEIWSHQPAASLSLTGSAPQLKRDGAHLLVVAESNYGCELLRLDLETGKPTSRPVFLGSERIDLAASIFSDDVCVLVWTHRLVALDRADGRQRWALPLPRGATGRWHAELVNGAVLLYPDAALPPLEPGASWRRALSELAAIPTVEGLQTAGTILYHGLSRRAFLLLAVDIKAGKKVQELRVPANGARATMMWGEGRAALATEGRLDRFESTSER